MAGEVSQALKADVRSRIGEPSEQGVLTKEIYGALNEAQRELLNQLNDVALTAVMEEYPISITADEMPYAYPTDLQRLRGVKYKTVEAKPWPVRHLGALANNVLHTPSETNVYLIQWSQADHLMSVAASPDGAVRNTNVVTITTTTAHGLSAADVDRTVVIAGVVPVGATVFNGTFTIASVPTTSSFTYAQTAANDTGGGGTATVTLDANFFLRAGSNTDGSEIVVRYLETPAVMSDTVDPSFLGNNLHGLMVTHAVMRMREKQNKDEEAERLWSEFNEGCAILNSRSQPVPPYDAKPGDRSLAGR